MNDKEAHWLAALTMAVVILVFFMLIDMYAGWRDMHHIRDLQRRVGELEQKR